ncbi:MAG: enoyl-CoA hydratase-related protein, partial [Betaproteobacteria bacterium]
MNHALQPAAAQTVDFDTEPSRYAHWKLAVDGEVATLSMDVNEERGLRPGYRLKLNSYDLGVDIELRDALDRIRFEHPAVKVVVLTSARERMFCSGANIYMLGQSSHAWKVNFCRFTNETRNGMEDSSRHDGLRLLAAVNGTVAGGGYELALACDEIHLVDDSNSAVSLPEVPLLAVLPGTGGLTRLVDKRKVRRDRADVFCTMAEGMRGKKAVAWGLVDAAWKKSQFADRVNARAKELAAQAPAKAPRGIVLDPIRAKVEGATYKYEYVACVVDAGARKATITVHAPQGPQPKDGPGYEQAGCKAWALQCWRELDDALLQLRFDHEEVGLIVLQTRGDRAAILQVEKDLFAQRSHWLVNEILRHMARVLRRFDLMARSTYALVDGDACMAGAFLELTLACDRVYMLDDDKVHAAVGPLSAGLLPMSHGLTR